MHKIEGVGGSPQVGPYALLCVDVHSAVDGKKSRDPENGYTLKILFTRQKEFSMAVWNDREPSRQQKSSNTQWQHGKAPPDFANPGNHHACHKLQDDRVAQELKDRAGPTKQKRADESGQKSI